MNRSSFFGNIYINQATIFDGHLVLLLLPVLALATIIGLKPKLWSASAKKLFIRISSTVLLGLSALSFIEYWNFAAFDQAMQSLAFINNLDIIVTLLLSVSLLTKRFGIARALVPCVIVFGATRLINNPGASISIMQIIVDVAGVSIALAILPIFRKAISIRANITVSVIALVVIGYVFVINKFLNSSYATFNLNDINANPVYRWMPGDVFVIVAFLSAFLGAQTFIWLVIRTTFRVSSKINGENLVQSLLIEWHETRKVVNQNVNKFQSFVEIKNDMFEFEDAQNQNSEDDVNLETLVEVDKQTWSTPDDVLPLQLLIVKTAHGIRAPSL